MPSHVWTPADALALRCDVDAVGTLAPPEVLERIPSVPEPEAIRRRATAALLRLAETGEGMAAVKAAVELLERYPPAPDPATPPARPDWEGLDVSARYAPARPSTHADQPALPLNHRSLDD